jgi:hypothetical protein
MDEKITGLFEEMISAKGWACEKKNCSLVPFQYGLSVLTTTKDIGTTNLKNLVLKVKEENQIPQAIVVMKNKKEANNLFNMTAKVGNKGIYLFFEREYTELSSNKELEDEISKNQVIITYAGASILRGQNFPKSTLLIVDCEQFQPIRTIMGLQEFPNFELATQVLTTKKLPEYMKDYLVDNNIWNINNPSDMLIALRLLWEQDKHRQLIQDVAMNLQQIFGRLFRSTQPRKPGETLRDRRLCVILHNCTVEFQLKSRLLYDLAIHQDTWLSDEEPVNSISDGIARCLQGLEPDDWYEKDQEALNSLDNKEKISVPKRNLINLIERHKIKDDEKIKQVKNKIKEFKLLGKTWREIAPKIHFYRDFTKKQQEELKQYFQEL